MYFESVKQLTASREILELHTTKLNEHESVLKKLNDKSLPISSLTSPSTPKRSFSQIVNNNGNQKTVNSVQNKKFKVARDVTFEKPPILIVEPLKDAMDEDHNVTDKIRAQFDPSNDPVNEIKPTKNGKTVIVCKNIQSMNAVKQKIQSSDLGSVCNVKEPKEKEKRLKIVGNFNPEIEDSEIITRIIKQNDCVPDNAVIEIVKRQNRSAYVCVVIKTDDATFTNVLNTGKVRGMEHL